MGWFTIALPTLIDLSDLIALLALLIFITLLLAWPPTSRFCLSSGGSSKKEEKRKAKEAEKKARTNLSHKGSTMFYPLFLIGKTYIKLYIYIYINTPLVVLI